jgi:tetratricopeptide (TPR) repeat protein
VLRVLVANEPDVDSYRALQAEVQLELGDYTGAGANFARLEAMAGDLSIAPRLARWYELHGRVEAARALLQAACATAVQRQSELPREQLAWFHLRLGDLEARAGDAQTADTAYRAGLQFDPTDHRLLLARARLAAGAGHWSQALSWSRDAAASVPDLPALLLLRDAYVATGDTAAATRWERAAAQRAGLEHRFNRVWSLDRLDRGDEVQATLVQVEGELRERPDVYGWDLYAWALVANGRPQEARTAMTHALRLGSRDPLFAYHAGQIEAALGNAAAARSWLRLALDASSGLAPGAAREARRTLATLDAQRPLHLAER